MKKKTSKKKKKPVKQKIDVVIESLVNLEQKVKELIAQVEQLRYSQSRFKDVEIDPKKYWLYWPNILHRYDSVSWNDGCQTKVNKN